MAVPPRSTPATTCTLFSSIWFGFPTFQISRSGAAGFTTGEPGLFLEEREQSIYLVLMGSASWSRPQGTERFIHQDPGFFALPLLTLNRGLGAETDPWFCVPGFASQPLACSREVVSVEREEVGSFQRILRGIRGCPVGQEAI